MVSSEVAARPDSLTMVVAKTNSATAQLAAAFKTLKQYQPELRLLMVLAPGREKLPNSHVEDIALHNLAMVPPENQMIAVPTNLLEDLDNETTQQPNANKRNLPDAEDEEDQEKSMEMKALEVVTERAALEAVFDPEKLRSKDPAEIAAYRQLMSKASKRADKLKKLLEEECIKWLKPNVIICTLANMHDFRLKNMKPNRIIVDELGQPLEVSLYHAITKLSHRGNCHFNGIGDCRQLPPITNADGDAGRLLAISMPQRMEQHEIVSNHRITLGYRMHPTLSAFVSHVTYDGQLQAAVTARMREMVVPFPLAHKDVPLILICMSSDAATSGHSYTNCAEAEVVYRLYKLYVELNGQPSLDALRIMSMYDAQRSYINSVIAGAGLPINAETVSSVDAMQGS